MSNNSTQNLISFDEVIRLSKLKGVNFGKGDPYNRLRYYIKIGLLPKASRKSFNGLPPAGALPMETVDRMVEIDEKIKEGKSIQTILKESKNETPIAPLTPNPSIQQSPIVDTKIDEDLGLFPVTEVPNSHNLSTSEEKPALNETGQPTSSNNLKGLHFATTFLKKNNLSKTKLAFLGLELFILVIGATYLLSFFGQNVSKDDNKQGLLIDKNSLPAITQEQGETLAETVKDGLLSVFVPTNITGSLTASGGIVTNNTDIDAGTGKLTASNVIYSLTPGSNISISGGQNPVISAVAQSVNLSGTANRITVSGTTVDIASNYTGQSSISTVGTITSGTWQASQIGVAYLNAGDCGLGNFIRSIQGSLVCAPDQSAGAPDFSTITTGTNTGETLTVGNGSTLTPSGSGVIVSNSINLSTATITGTLADSRLTTNVALLNGNQTFSGNNTFSSASNSFTGSGAGLTALNASSISSGTLATARGGLGGDVTAATAGEILYSTGTTTYDSLAAGSGGQCLLSGGAGAPSWGSCGGITGITIQESDGNVSVSSVTTVQFGPASSSEEQFIVTDELGGTARIVLGTNVPLLNANQTFSGINTFNNASNSFTGVGSGLTSLNASNVSSGTLADARLTTNVALLNGNQTFSGNNTFSSASNSFTGDGSGLTSLNASNISSGTLATARGGLGGDVTAATAGEILYSTSTTAYGHLAAGTLGNCLISGGAGAPTWGGCGGISGIIIRETDGTPTVNPVTTLEFGPATTSSDEFLVTDEGSSTARVRLGSQVPLLNATQTFTGVNTFSNASNSFTGSFTGSGSGLTSLNASNISSGTLAVARGGLGGVIAPAGAGEILYSSSSSAFTTLAAGTAGFCLTSNGAAAPQWSSCGGIAGINVRESDGTPSVASVTQLQFGPASTSSDQFIVTDQTGGVARVVLGNKVVLTDATQTLTNKTIAAGSNTISGLTNANLSGTAGITNANLANSSITINNGLGITGGGSVSLGGSISLGFDTSSALSGDYPLTANQVQFGQSGLIFEGASDDTIETYIVIADPTISDRVFTFPDVASGNVCISNVACISTSGDSATSFFSSGTLETSIGGLGANVTAATAGEILYSTGTTTYDSLAAGTVGNCLLSGGVGAPSWGSCGAVAGGITVRESDTSPSVSGLTTIEFGPATTSSDQFIVTDQTGGVARIVLGTQVPLLNASQTFSGVNTFSNASNSFTGDGSGLTSLNASNISSGTLATARGGLGGDVTAATAGEILYSTGTTTYDSLAAGSGGQCLLSGGAGAPSWGSCGAVAGGITVRESDTSPSVSGITTIEFGPASTSQDEFIVSDQTGGVVRIRTGNKVVLTDATQTLTNKTIAAGSNTISGLTNGNLSGSAGITNANLANSSITINNGLGITGGGSVSLGGNLTLGFDTSSALTGDYGLTANQVQFGQSGLIFEGATADTIETFIAIADPTSSDRVFTFPDVASGNVCISNVACIATTGDSATSFFSTGTLEDARLSANVALLDATQTFTGINTFSNASNSFTGSFAGDGSGLTSLNANSIASGLLATARGGLGADVTAAGAGEILYSTSTTTYDSLASGTAGFCLTSNGAAAPQWSSCGGIAGINVRESDGTPSVSSVTQLQFGPATTSSDEFIVSDQTGGVARVRLGSQVPLLNATQTFTQANTFSHASNSFTGIGSGLTSLNASNISSGTLNDARLSANVALLNANQTFSGNNTFSSASNSFTGDGSGLTSLNASNISSGTLATARGGLGGDVTAATAGEILYSTGTTTYDSLVAGTAGNCLLSGGAGAPTWGSCGAVAGGITIRESDGTPSVSGLTTVEFGPASASSTEFIVTDQTGGVARVILGTNIPRLNGNQTFSGNNTFSSASNSFTGSGAGLTALNASSISSGTLADARLTTNVALLNGNQTFSGNNTFSSASNSFTGDGSGLTSLNASNISSGTLATARGGLGGDVTAAGAGEILYSTGTTTYDSLAAGTAGFCLKSGGAGAPSWSSCGAAAGGITVRESDTSPSVSSIITLEFGPATTSSDQFIVTDQTGGVARVVLGNKVVLTDATQTLTNKTIAAGSNTISGLTNANLSGTAGITNANLANSSITFQGDTGSSGTSLGGTRIIAGGTGITTAESAGTVTVTANTSAGITTSGDNIILDQTFSPTWTGAHTFTPSGTGDLTINLDADSTLIKTFSSGTNATSGETYSITNSSTSGTVAVNGTTITLVGTNTSGANTLTGINFANATTATNNTINGLTFGTGFNNFLTSGTINISAAGAITGATGITSSGTIIFSAFSANNNSVLYAGASGTLGVASTTGTGNCLLSNGSGAAPSWGSCGAGASGQTYSDGVNPDITGATKLTFDGSYFVVGGPSPNATVTVKDDSFNFVQLADSLSLDASTTITADNNKGITFTSDLTGGNRATSFITINQNNNATFNSTLPLLDISNNDTASSGALIFLNNLGTGAALNFAQDTTVSNGIRWGVDANNVTLYRSANDTLKTDDTFIAGGDIVAAANTINPVNPFKLTAASSTRPQVFFDGTASCTNGAYLEYDRGTDQFHVKGCDNGLNSIGAYFDVTTASGADALINLSDADVAHGITGAGLGSLTTDTFARLTSISSTAGGALLTGVSDTDATGLKLQGAIGTATPTATTPAISLVGYKKNGTGVQALAATETVFQITNNTSNLFTLFGNGDITIADDSSIGLGSSAGRFTFDSTANPDTITVNNARLILSATSGEGISGGGLDAGDCSGSSAKLLYSTSSKLFSCGTDQTGAAPSVRLDQILAANTSDTDNDNLNNNISWDWSTLTTQRAFTFNSTSTALTIGGILGIGSTTTAYNHGAAETGSLFTLNFKDTTSGTFASTTNGLLLSPEINITAGAATKTVNGISVNPTFTACTTANCNVNGLNIGAVTDSGNFNGSAINIGTGWDNSILFAQGSGVTHNLRVENSTSGNGGSLTITTGSATAGNAGGGSFNVTAGSGFGTGVSSSGGSINLTAGQAGATGSGAGGAINITAGAAGSASGTGVGGGIFISSGVGGTTSGASGTIQLATGATSSGATGALTIATGNAIGGASGAISLNVGTGTSTGAINIGSTNSTTINIGTGTTATNTVNIATGTQADAINIGTGGTNADTITLGNTGVATTFNLNTGVSTATALTYTANSINSGTAFSTSANALTSGRVFDVNSTATNVTFTGDLQRLVLDRTVSSGTTDHTGNLLDISRTFTKTASSTTTLSGDVVLISDSSLESGGSFPGALNVTGSLLELNRSCGSGATCTGPTLNIVTGGTGADIAFNTTPIIDIGDGGSLIFRDGTNTLCTIADAGTTGNLSCTGNITGASTGTVGYWTRSGTTLSPATANDIITIGTVPQGSTGLAITTANITSGTTNALTLTTGTLTTAGTQNGINISSGSAGSSTTLNAINIGTASGASTAKTAINIGSGWDVGVNLNYNASIKAVLGDGSVDITDPCGTGQSFGDSFAVCGQNLTGINSVGVEGLATGIGVAATSSSGVGLSARSATGVALRANLTGAGTIFSGLDNGTTVFNIADGGYTTITAPNANGSSANALTLNGTLGNFDGSDTFNGLNISYINGTHTNSSNAFNAINVANLSSPSANATETALKIGSGWDNAISIDTTHTTSAISETAILFTGTITKDSAIESYYDVSNLATVNITADPGAFGSDIFYKDGHTSLISTSTVSANTISFFSGPTIRTTGANQGTRTVTSSVGAASQINLENTGTGTTALVLTNYYAFQASSHGSVFDGGWDAGTTLSNYYGFYVENQDKGSGTLTTQHGLYIENLTSGNSDYGIYLAGADTANIYATIQNTSSGVTRKGIDLNTNGSFIGASTVTGIDIGAITDTNTASTAIKFNSGWDNALYFSPTSNTIKIGNTGSLTFTDDANGVGATGNTLCTISDAGSTGNLSCTGNITGASTGTIGYWSRASSVLSPATSNDVVAISSNAVSAGGILDLTASGTITSGNNAVRLTANSVTTGTGIAATFNSLSTGTGVSVSRTGGLSSGGKLISGTIDDSAGSGTDAAIVLDLGYTIGNGASGGFTTAGASNTGSVINASRTLYQSTLPAGTTTTAGGSSAFLFQDKVTVTGGLNQVVRNANFFTIADCLSSCAGTNSQTLLNLSQGHSAATGTALKISYAGTGFNSATAGTLIDASITGNISGTTNLISITGKNSQGSGTQNALNINSITPGAATETAINIGSGWDKQINGTGFNFDGTGNLTLSGTNFTNTSGAGTFSLTSTSTTTPFGVTDNSLLAQPVAVFTSTNGGSPIGSNAQGFTINLTNSITNAFGLEGLLVNYTHTSTTSTTSNVAHFINKLSNTASTTSLNSILYLEQADTTASGTVGITNGLLIATTGNSGITNGINISGNNITNGISIDNTSGATTAINIGTGWNNLFNSGTVTIAGTGNITFNQQTLSINNTATTNVNSLFTGSNVLGIILGNTSTVITEINGTSLSSINFGNFTVAPSTGATTVVGGIGSGTTAFTAATIAAGGTGVSITTSNSVSGLTSSAFKATLGNVSSGGGFQIGLDVVSGSGSNGRKFGVRVGDLSSAGAGEESAIRIGTGWDNSIVLGLSTTSFTHTIRLEDQTTAATAGSNFALIGAAGNTTGAGGSLSFTAGSGGTGGAAGSAGGAINLTTGTGTAAGSGNNGGVGGSLTVTLGNGGTGIGSGNGGVGGSFALTAGNGATGGTTAVSVGGAGGAITLVTGNGGNNNNFTAGSGGAFSLTTGNGGTLTAAGFGSGFIPNGGTVTITTGTGGTAFSTLAGTGGNFTILLGNGGGTTQASGTGGVGGSFALTAGNAGLGSASTGNVGGAITFTSGSGTGNGNGGNISFRPGLGSGSGINGQIVLGNGDGGTPSNTTIRGAAASGTNVAGADLYFDASNGTGTGGSGSFLFRTAPATGPSYVTTGSTTFFSTSGNLSYTVAAGSNRLLVVGVSVPSGNVNSVSSVTFGGQALTNLTTVTSAGTDRPRVEIWYLKEAGITAAIGVSGTANITVTVNTTLDIVFGATNYTNVDQTTSFGTAVTNSGTDTNPTVNVSTSTEDIVFDTMHKCNTGVCGSATVTVGAPPQTQRWNTSTGNTHGSASTKPGNGGTVTMNWTLNNSRSWAIAAVPIKGTTTGQTNTLEERLKISQSGIYISGPATGSTYGLCFDCDGTFGNATVQNGIAWGTDSTITNNLFAYRSGNGQYTLSDGAGTILLQASTSQFTLNLDNTTSFTERLCHNGSNGATTAQRIGDCQSSGQADFAEYYGSFENLEPGEVIVTNGEASQFDHETLGHVSKAFVGKSTQTYQKELIGVVSTNPFSEILSSDIFAENENPVPVALSGRVPVKVSTENGPIEPGDPLTSSSTPGVAMKATQAGPIIGKSLESYSNSDPNVVEKIIVFVEAGYFTPQIAVNETTLTGLENISTNDLIAVNISASSLIVSDSINIGDKITMNKDGKLTVNGEIIIAGKITLTGDIFISGKVSAKTVAAEEFQVKSTEEGNDKTAGVATVIAGTDELVINSTKVDDTSLVFVTPTKQTNLQLAVVEKLAGTSFKVKLNALATEDVSFNWLIVNQQISQGN